MYKSVYRVLKNLKQGSEGETNGRHIIAPWAVEAARDLPAPRILDIGAGRGGDLFAIRERLAGATLAAIEGYPPSIEVLRENGVDAVSIDLERDRLPFDDASFDIVICNQVFEHLKEIFWLLSEIGRVCADQGAIIIGVPNLGSLHNRVALLFGKQPPAAHVFGPHVRAITIDGFRDFVVEGGHFSIEKIAGGNFYPLPKGAARAMAGLFPGLAVSAFFLLRKEGREGRFIDVMNGPRRYDLVDTPYFSG